MADLRCPMCGNVNPEKAAACKFCGARLSPMRAGEPQTPAGTPPSAQGENDWMADFRGDMMRNRPKTSMLPPEPPPPPPPSDDWLNRIREQEKPEPRRSSPLASKPQAPRPAAPSPREPSKPAKVTPKPAAETPGWLSKVRDQVSAERQDSSPRQEEEKEEEPPWLKRLRVRKTQENLAPASPPEPEAEAAAPGELPEWLSKIRDKAAAESGQEEKNFFGTPLSAPAQPFSASASPWGQTAPKPGPGAEKPAPRKAAEENIPDWLKAPPDSGRPSGAEPPVGSPDWMGSISSAFEETPPIPPAAAPQTTAAPKTGSGRLAEIEGAKRKPLSQTRKIAPKAKPPDTGFVKPPPSVSPPFGPEWEFPAEASTELPFPGFEAGTGAPSASSAFSAGTEPSVAPGGEEGIPSWLADVKKTTETPPPAAAEEPPISTPDIGELLSPESMPDWLKKPSETTSSEKGAAKPGAPAAPENLEHAELPRWLEAMRPIQTVAVPTEDDERVESVGPLAGLRGVLSAEPVMAMPRRPNILAGTLDTSPAQLAQTETLRRLLIEPEIRAARRPVRAMSLTPILRKTISVFLLLFILLPIMNISLFSTSVFTPEANQAAGNLVNALPADRPVLVAFEYEPSSASEVESGATALLEHLARRGIPIAIISSKPGGTMLGKGLIQMNGELCAPMPALLVDFGYLPGGAGGLRRLAFDLRGTVKKPNPDWNQEQLVGLTGISSFSMIAVIAADPQSVRDWVEQVHTALPSTPIVAVVSAAADALIFPYTQGRQPALWGLVTGYIGAQGYRGLFLTQTPESGCSNILQQQSALVAAMRWQAFGGGILVLLAALGIGVIVSLAAGIGKQAKKAGE